MPFKAATIYLYHQYLLEQGGYEDEDTYKRTLSEVERRNRDRRIPRMSLRRYGESPFQYLFQSGNDQALLNLTGLDHSTFNELLALFEPQYNCYTFECKSKMGNIRRKQFGINGKPMGRRREMDPTGCLGAVLMWYRSRGACTRGLIMAFGSTATPFYRWVTFGRRVLLGVLLKVESARVKYPTEEEIRQYTYAIAAKYPLLPDIWGACDGLKLLCEMCKDWYKQNSFYNGWTNNHYVSCIFVFAADGRIRMCVLNSPGCWHDSNQADYGVYQKLKTVWLLYRARVVVDSAFTLSHQHGDYLVKSYQIEDASTPEELLRHRSATSIRQLSEWGMRMIEAKFPRLKDKMKYEEVGERRVILNLMVLLYNFSCFKIGHNEILSTFMHDRNNYFGRYENIGEVADVDMFRTM